MELRCDECGNDWLSDRGSLDEFADGPRCSECDSRDVEVVDDGDEPLYAVAFRRFEEGDTALDLVRAGLADPDRARELADEYEEMAARRWLSPEELEDARAEAFERGVKRGKREGRETAREVFERRLQRECQRAYNQGYNEGVMASFIEDNQDYTGDMIGAR